MSSRNAREKILAATRRLLEEGRADVGLEEVAKNAGVSRQAVYLHFGSRTKLLLALVNAMDEEQLPPHLAKVMAAPSALQALDAMVDVSAQYTAEIFGVAVAIDSARRSDEAAAAAWDDRMTSRRGAYVRLVTRLDEEALLTPHVTRDEAADLLFVLLSIRVWEDLIVGRKWSIERYARHMKRLIRRALVVATPKSRVKKSRRR